MVSRRQRGLFFVFEGIDGSGKSTVVKRLAGELRNRGFDVLETCEPTGSEWGRKIRRIAAEGRAGISPSKEAWYFIKDRRLHVEEEIKPALESGKIVLCDRYYFSAIAYQGALGLSKREICRINEEEHHFPVPDRVFFLDVPLEAALARITGNRPEGANAGYEKKEFLEKVKAIFDSTMEGSNFVRVDATQPPEKVGDAILKVILPLIEA